MSVLWAAIIIATSLPVARLLVHTANRPAALIVPQADYQSMGGKETLSPLRWWWAAASVSGLEACNGWRRGVWIQIASVGVGVVAAKISSSTTDGLATAVLGWGLLAIAIDDMRTLSIDLRLVTALGLLGLLLQWWNGDIVASLGGAVGCGVWLGSVALLGRLRTGQVVIGDGDVWLAAAGGIWLAEQTAGPLAVSLAINLFLHAALCAWKLSNRAPLAPALASGIFAARVWVEAGLV